MQSLLPAVTDRSKNINNIKKLYVITCPLISFSTLSSLLLLSSALFLQSCPHGAYMVRQNREKCGPLVTAFSMQSRLPSVTDRQKTSKNMKKLYVITSQLISSFSTRCNLLLVSSALFLQSCLWRVMVRQNHERIYCRSLVSVFSMQGLLPSVNEHLKLAVITNQLISFSTASNLFLVSSALLLQSCLHGVSWCVKTARNVDLWSLLFQCGVSCHQSLIDTKHPNCYKTVCHNKSTDFLFYRKQPPPRTFCALPPIVPTWCVKVRQNREKCGPLVTAFSMQSRLPSVTDRQKTSKNCMS